MRSQIQPPSRQPAPDKTPPSTPVTSATVSAVAPQSPATAAQRLEAAPEPIGRKHRKSARKPRRDFATLHTSPNKLTNVLRRVVSRIVDSGSGRKKRPRQHRRHAPARIAHAIHGAGRRSASHSPTPPPMPAPQDCPPETI